MNNFQSEIQRLTEGFVAALTTLWRKAATEALAGVDAGGGGGGGGGGGTVGRPRKAAATGGGSRRKGEKRTSDELEALSKRFIDYVAKNPGLRIEQINKVLNTTTKDLQLPIRKLIADGDLKAKGTKRSTTYTAK